MKIGKEQETVYRKSERIFSVGELEKFHTDIQQFRITKKISDGEEVSFIDFDSVHKFKNTISKYGGVYLESDGFGGHIYPTRYERLENKIAQYINWQSRKQYVENEEIKQLEELANKVNIKGEINVEDIPF